MAGHKLLENTISGNANDKNEKVRVMLVNDHEAMREGLRNMLRGDESIRVVGEARDSQEALARAKQLSPDVVLMDVNMPGMDGIETSRCLKESQLPMSIIILAGNRRYLTPAIKAGAVGFLPRNISHDDLIVAIRIIHLWRLNLFHIEGARFALVKL